MEFENSIIPYHIRRNIRAKRIIIKIAHEDLSVVIVAPPGVLASKIHSFVKERAAWIHEKTVGSTHPVPPKRKYCTGEVYPWFGGEFKLKIVKGRDQSASISNGELIIHIPEGLIKPDEEVLVRNIVECFFRNGLYKYSLPYFRKYSENLEIPFPVVKVTNKKTSWGTCTPKSVVLNLRLCMAPPDIIEYVIAHELCHKLHPNHSPQFWETLRKVLPDYETRKKFLNEKGYLWTL